MGIRRFQVEKDTFFSINQMAAHFNFCPITYFCKRIVG